MSNKHKKNLEEKEIKITEPVYGTVCGCESLNIRKVPNGEILGTVTVGTKLMIETDSNDDWCHIYTSEGIEGFCMRKFVNIE